MAGNLLMQYVTPRVTMNDLAAQREARQMRALQMEGVQRQNALGELTMQDTMAERERKQREANVLQQLLQQSGGDEGRLIQGLQNSGIPGLWERGRAMADARTKAQQEADKAAAAAGRDKAETEAKTLANRKAEIALRYQTLLQLPDQRSAAEAINAEESLTPEQRAQIIQSIPADPMQFKAWKLDMYFRATGDADKLLPKVETRDTGGAVQTMAIDPLTGAATVTNKADKTQSPDNKASNDRQARDAAAARAVTMRGQDMTDRRVREFTTNTMTKPFEVTGPDGKPMLVRQDKAGNITPVEGFSPKTGSAKPLTDAQGKALLFGSRAREADKIITELEGKYSPAAVNAKTSLANVPLIGGALEMAGNAMLTDSGQRAEQAQRDFVNAVLRRESGAVISEQEFENAKRQYFPQPGDTPAVKAQKKKNRELAVRGMLAEVPDGQRDSLSTPDGMPDSGMDLGDGFRVK